MTFSGYSTTFRFSCFADSLLASGRMGCLNFLVVASEVCMGCILKTVVLAATVGAVLVALTSVVA